MTKKRRRPIHLHVMVSEAEQALIQERMAEAGIRNMGAYKMCIRDRFDAPIAELAEVKGVSIDEAVKMRTDAVLQEAVVPVSYTHLPLPPCMPFPRALTGFPVSSTAKVMYCLLYTSTSFSDGGG